MPLIAILFINLAMSEPREVLVPNHRAEKYSNEILESSSKISATKKYLKFDSATICDVIINKKDLKEDFPDSVWNGFLIGPIRDRIKSELKRNPSKQFVFDFDSSLVFATIKPVIRAAATGGASSAIVLIGQNKAIKIELFKEIKEKHITHSADGNSMGVVLLMRRDSLIAYDNAPEVNPNRVLGLLSPNADTLTLSDAELLESFLTSIRKRTGDVVWVGIDPHPATVMAKINQIFAIINKVNSIGSKQWMNSYLLGVFLPWSAESVRQLQKDKAFCDSISALGPIQEVEPIYPERERLLNCESTVEVEVLLEKSGKVEEIIISKSGGKAFDKAVIDAIKKTQYRQPCAYNEPSSVRFKKTFKFQIADDKEPE